MREIIVLLGPPASGKGTQAMFLVENFKYLSLSTGSLLRKEIATGSDLGKSVANVINKGNLVPDELIFDVLKSELSRINADKIILDGFPRTLKQAELFSEYLETSEFKLKKVFMINLSKEAILERIRSRITCKNCGAIYNAVSKRPKVEGVCDVCHSTNLVSRADDLDMEAVIKRIDIFDNNKDSILSFYRKKSLIFLIDGLKDVKAINCEIIKALNVN